jgi:hypothetical protein
MFADEQLHRHAAENLAQADALLFGRVTYEMMEAARARGFWTAIQQLKRESGKGLLVGGVKFPLGGAGIDR